MPAAQLLIRPIKPSDKAALTAAVKESSDKDVFRRLLNPRRRLSHTELRYLTEVDHHDHEALIALNPASGGSVGVARYVRDLERHDSAEIAIAVLKPWQHRGVGRALLHQLTQRAREEKVSQFTALMLADNRPLRHLLEDLARPSVVDTDAGTVVLATDLLDPPATVDNQRIT